ncbi:MAG: flagellar basal body rod protein FlgB [Desulfobacterota bacterium]|nr:flagellar basal body rod protein FlgB [Thermodesulfobacteriota bacterium]
MPFDLFGPTYSLLAKALDLRSQRHAVIASNIANAETPGYKAVSLRFEDELNKIISSRNSLHLVRTNPNHLPYSDIEHVRPVIVQSLSRVTRIDGNTVDLEEELTALSKNQIMYDALAQILKRKFDGLASTIKELK